MTYVTRYVTKSDIPGLLFTRIRFVNIDESIFLCPPTKGYVTMSLFLALFIYIYDIVT